MSRIAWLCSLLLLLACSETILAQPKAAPRPNIVIILADDLGYGDLGCYNAKSKIPTPALDRLAREGMRFTDAHSPSAVCSPTRYGLLTGRYPWRSSLKRGVIRPWGAPLIEKGRLTLPAMLRRLGYATACIGKWHLGWTWPTKDGQPPSSGKDRLSNVDFSKPIANGPTTRGFDRYFGTDVPNYPPFCFIENDRTVGIPSEPSGPEFNVPGPMLPGWKWVNVLPELSRQSVKYIEEAARADPRKPFFLYLPLTSPHFPIVPAAEFRGKSKAGDYGDFVVQTDWVVGEVLKALERTKQAENTLVVFTSDNGPEVAREVRIGAYDRLQKFDHASMGPLRGVKRDLWEGGHRVPFLVRWPGHVKAGTVNDQLIVHTDLMATLADIVGAKLPNNAAEDSVNMWPAFQGKKVKREGAVFAGSSGKLAIRQGDWVLIDAPTGQENPPAWGEPDWFKKQRGYTTHKHASELYNLADDLAQKNNRVADEPERVKALRALLEKYQRERRSVPKREVKPIPREVREVEGWKIHVDRQLLEGKNAELGARALRVLGYKLYEIKHLIAADRLARLQKVEIVLDLEYPRLTSMQYHPSAGWLKANGHELMLVKKVHLPRAHALTTRLPINQQPMVILHELAHAYHDQVLGFDEKRIKAAWVRFKDSGKYESVMHISGKPRRHYALTNQMEFFAEMTEAYFGTNDFFPFVRSELRQELPDVYKLLEEIWGPIR